MLFARDLGMAAVLTGVACAPPVAATPYPSSAPQPGGGPPGAAGDQVAAVPGAVARAVEGSARYFDRKVNVASFVAGFPFADLHSSLKTDRLFYYALGDRYTLKMLDISKPGAWDLASGVAISNEDWSHRSLLDLHHHEASNTLWLHAEASNDQRRSVWVLALETGVLTQVTFADDVEALGFSEDDSRMAYLSKEGKAAPFRTCLRIRDPAADHDREVVCDAPALTFWGTDLRFTPDNREVLLRARVQGEASRLQLVRVDVTKPEPRVEPVTDPDVPRSELSLLKGWLGTELLFAANDDGFTNLYAYDRVSRRTRQVTRLTEDLRSIQRSGDRVVGVQETPTGVHAGPHRPQGGRRGRPKA